MKDTVGRIQEGDADEKYNEHLVGGLKKPESPLKMMHT